MTTFNLHPDLIRDGIDMGQFDLCRVLLINDSHYPWFVLVPERVDISDTIDWLVVFSTFFYLLVAIKHFYKQGWFKSFIKTTITSFLFLLLVAPLTAILLGVFAFMFY